MNREIDSVSQEIEDQMKHKLELAQMKTILDGSNGRLGIENRKCITSKS